jgi:methionine sulfoxide reductase heme-binding subunit
VIKVLKVLVFLLCLAPFVWLVWGFLTNNLGADPLGQIRAVTGRWTLRFLLITLSITPLRRITGWNAAIRFRRMLGLFAFFWGFWHFITYLLVQGFNWPIIGEDIVKRPYITLGLTGFILMIPLAITSTKKWIVRLGKRWQQLHRLIYVSAIAGVIHYLWLVKADIRYPVRYIVVLALLLGFRIWLAVRPQVQSRQPIGG